MNQILSCISRGYVFKEESVFVISNYLLCVLWPICLFPGASSEDSWL